MHHFEYRNGVLHAEDVSLETIAAEVGTPFYVYSTATLTRHVEVVRQAFASVGLTVGVAFAMKSNGNLAVLKTLAALGVGADVVSGGEAAIAMKAGIPADKIVFSGVAKTAEEITFALKSGLYQINVESVPELEQIDRIAGTLGVKAPIALRVNPDVAGGAHAKINTGKKENKFGIDWAIAHSVARKAVEMKNVALKGIALHVGSQIVSLDPFEAAYRRIRDLVVMLRADGIAIERIDLGGGLGVPYYDGADIPALPPEYAAIVKRCVGDLGCEIMAEPGRLIVGNAGLLVSKTVYVKDSGDRRFLILDAGFNDLIRPAMYDGYHAVVPVKEPAADAETSPVDIVGPICESGDTFAKDRPMPPVAQNDLVAFKTAGAYGSSMSSQYNGRPLVPEVMVNGDRFAVVRRRPTIDEMLELHHLPDWLK